MSSQPSMIIGIDEDTKATTSVSDGGELIVAPRQRLAGGVFNAALAPWFKDSSTGGGSVPVVNAAAEVHSGVAVAGRGLLESMHRARVVLPQANHNTIVASLGSLVAGGRYRFGVFDANDGFFFQVTGGATILVTRKAGADTAVTPPPPFLVVDNARHVYTIRYLVTRVHFFQDSDLSRSISSTIVGPLVQQPDLPIRVEAENISAAGTDFIITVANASISRVGPLVDAAGAVITRPATSTVSAQLIAGNHQRRTVVIVNDSSRNLYIKFGATATTTDYAYVLPRGAQIAIDGRREWSGRIDGILDSGTGSAQVTETAEV